MTPRNHPEVQRAATPPEVERPCEACGSPDPRPVTHKTWCSVRILEPSLHRFGPAKELTGRVAA